jgi:hypothetical protein
MAIPFFGYDWTESAACLTLVVVGLAGLWLSLDGSAGELAALLHTYPLPAWLPLNPGRVWLSAQSLLVIAGGVGAWRCNSFTLAVIGVAAALIVVTPVGLLSFLPGLWMLILISPRWMAFFPERYGWHLDRDA